MTEFGKRVDGVHGRRGGNRKPVLVAAAMMSVKESGSATLLNVSYTGAKLRGGHLPACGEDALVRVARVEAFGTVVWKDGDLCGIAFDVPLSDAELKILEQQSAAVSIAKLTPEELVALDDWQTGFAR